MEIIAWLSMAWLSFALGGWMRDSAWRNNAGAPMRMCVKGQFYKVVRLNDEHSGDMLSIHGSEILVPRADEDEDKPKCNCPWNPSNHDHSCPVRWFDWSRNLEQQLRESQARVAEWKPCYEYPEMGKPVLGYHRDWIDPDFCEDGIRECFAFGDGTEWQSARWDGYSDQWIVEDGAPEFWQEHPQPPQQGGTDK